MSKRMIIPLLFGLIGCAILLSLGAWQVKRLAWKEAILAEIEANIAAAPLTLPEDPTATDHKYMPVEVSGTYSGDELHVLFSLKQQGAGYRIIAKFSTDTGRDILIDRGYVPTPDKDQLRPGFAATVQGNLHWPEEIDSFTPEPDINGNIWFARDLPAMAAALGTEPVLIVARASDPVDTQLRPVPVTATGIPNDHLQYAITWFLLAAAWAGMTAYLLWRIRQRTV